MSKKCLEICMNFLKNRIGLKKFKIIIKMTPPMLIICYLYVDYFIKMKIKKRRCDSHGSVALSLRAIRLKITLSV